MAGVIMTDDITTKILEEIRDEIRGQRADHNRLVIEMNARFVQARTEADARVAQARTEADARFAQARTEADARFEAIQRESNARFEIVESCLRDLAQQLVMLSRGIKVAIEGRAANDERFADHEARITELERRRG